jgi:MFS superfamily sulfate permease-like transporter
MSYAKLAGLSPVYGLYTGLMPVFIYGLFGSSRQLAVGPVAIVSQLVHTGLLSMVDPSKGATRAEKAALQAQYTGLAITLSLFVSFARPSSRNKGMARLKRLSAILPDLENSCEDL